MPIQVNVMENEYLRGIFFDGWKEGFREGVSGMLLRQLQRRFGALPAWVEEKVRQAPLERLERWGEQMLEARTLDEVVT